MRRRTVVGLAVLLGSWALIAYGVVRVKQPFAGRDASCNPARVDPKRLEAHVRTMAERFHPRDFAHPLNLDQVAAYVERAFREAGGRVSVEPYVQHGREYRNVVASFGPEAGERVVVGAHYDAVKGTPGADDNASGVAVLLELARALGRRAPGVRVDLVALTLEEPPYFRTDGQGSAVYAAGLAKEGVKVRAMLSLEMLGSYTDAKGSQHFPVAGLTALYPGTGNFVAVVGRLGEERLVRTLKRAMAGAGGVPVESINAPPQLEGIDFSDHASFWAHGFPAAMVTDTAFFRNAHYHTAEDTPETLDYVRMARAGEAVECGVRALAAR